MYKVREPKQAEINTSAIDTSVAVFFTPSPVTELLDITTVSTDGQVVHKFTDDVGLLFNQQRLENLGVDSINAWLKGLHVDKKENPYLKDCSDEQLLNFCKSRFIQSPSELKSWIDYLQSCGEDKAQELINSVTLNDDVEPVKTDSNE